MNWQIDTATVYRYGREFWRFPDKETAALAQQIAADNLAYLRETRAEHAEWQQLPLIVLAGLR